MRHPAPAVFVDVLLPVQLPAVLLSLAPRFADSILDGEKTLELRRSPMKELPAAGTLAFLYATAPRSALVGVTRIWPAREVRPADPDLRDLDAAAVNLREWIAYGPRYGLDVEPLYASPWRRLPPGIRPPQSFRYVRTSQDFAALAALAGLSVGEARYRQPLTNKGGPK